jgi:hypothetical protein
VPLTSTVVPLRLVFAKALAVCARAGVAGIAVTIRARTIATAEIRKILLCFISKPTPSLSMKERKTLFRGITPLLQLSFILLTFFGHHVWGCRFQRNFPGYFY